MAGIVNPIVVGYEWGQNLQFRPGHLTDGADLRADFRYSSDDPAALFTLTSGDGIERLGDLVVLTVSAARTSLLTAAGQTRVLTELVEPPGRHLGFRLVIPVARPVTRPS